MKRTVVLLLVIALISALCGCKLSVDNLSSDFNGELDFESVFGAESELLDASEGMESDTKINSNGDNASEDTSENESQPNHSTYFDDEEWLVMIKSRTGVNTTGKTFDGKIAEDFIWLLENATVLQSGVDFDGESLNSSGDYQIRTKTDTYYIDFDYEARGDTLYHIEGKTILELSEELNSFLSDMWRYYPYNSYAGRVENGKLTMHHAFEAETTIDIKVEEISQSSVELEVVSTIDQTVGIALNCYESDDLRGIGSKEELTLKAGIPQKVSLSFSQGHIIDIYCGNTKLHIAVMS